MKNTNLEEVREKILTNKFPKENINYSNHEREDKLFINGIEDKEIRVFGKDLKNSQSNLLPLDIKNYEKNIGKSNKIEKIENNCKKVKKEENSVLEIDQTISEDSELPSQIIYVKANSNLTELLKYKDLTLASDNNCKESLKFSRGEVIKVGNNYMRKNSVKNNTPKYINTRTNNSCEVINQNIEKCYREYVNNPQYLVEYIKEIHTYLKESENINAPQHGYFSNLQDGINERMRAILVDWIIEVHQKFKLLPETLYLTVNLIDRFLSVRKIERSKLQLLAVGSMLIASKYEEIYAPEIRDFVYVTDKSYSRDEIIKMEYLILSSLNFNILQVSPYEFLKRYHFVSEETIKSFYLSQYVLEVSLLEYKMLQYSCSIKAASSLYISRKLLKLEPSWPNCLVSVSGYKHTDLKNCVNDMCKILEIIPKISLLSCIHKFSSQKYMEVAKMNILK